MAVLLHFLAEVHLIIEVALIITLRLRLASSDGVAWLREVVRGLPVPLPHDRPTLNGHLYNMANVNTKFSRSIQSHSNLKRLIQQSLVLLHVKPQDGVRSECERLEPPYSRAASLARSYLYLGLRLGNMPFTVTHSTPSTETYFIYKSSQASIVRCPSSPKPTPRLA